MAGGIANGMQYNIVNKQIPAFIKLFVTVRIMSRQKSNVMAKTAKNPTPTTTGPLVLTDVTFAVTPSRYWRGWNWPATKFWISTENCLIASGIISVIFNGKLVQLVWSVNPTQNWLIPSERFLGSNASIAVSAAPATLAAPATRLAPAAVAVATKLAPSAVAVATRLAPSAVAVASRLPRGPGTPRCLRCRSGISRILLMLN